MESKVYNQTAKESGTIKLPESVFGLPWNNELVQQVVTSMMGNARHPWAHTKNRGEVSGTGIKPWRQKGTGRARHGSRRSPIWVGGGIAHGPRKDRVYTTKINKKMRAKALFTILSKKFKEGEVVFVDSISLKEPKTKLAKVVLDSFAKSKDFTSFNKKNNMAFFAFEKKDNNTLKGFRNFANIELGAVKDLSPVDLLKYKYVVIESPENSVKILEARLANKPKTIKTKEVKPKVVKIAKVAKVAKPKTVKAKK